MIHPTAQVHPDAQIHPSVEIGPGCIVGPHVKIGARTRLLGPLVLEGWTELGEENVLFPFSVVGSVPQDLKYRGEPTQLILGNRNTIREGATLHLGTVQGGGVTRIGNDCLIMAYSHIGHDSTLGDHCIIANYGGLAGHVVLEDYVTIGGMTGVSQFVRVGEHAYIGGQSGLERDIPPYTIAVGSRPCLLKGTNIVGLKRRGFAIEVIQKLNEMIKFWVSSELQREAALVEMESQFGEAPEVQKFISFIRKSETGVLR